MGLRYKFSAYALYMVKQQQHQQKLSLRELDLTYTSVSQLHMKQIMKVLKVKYEESIIRKVNQKFQASSLCEEQSIGSTLSPALQSPRESKEHKVKSAAKYVI